MTKIKEFDDFISFLASIVHTTNIKREKLRRGQSGFSEDELKDIIESAKKAGFEIHNTTIEEYIFVHYWPDDYKTVGDLIQNFFKLYQNQSHERCASRSNDNSMS